MKMASLQRVLIAQTIRNEQGNRFVRLGSFDNLGTKLKFDVWKDNKTNTKSFHAIVKIQNKMTGFRIGQKNGKWVIFRWKFPKWKLESGHLFARPENAARYLQNLSKNIREEEPKKRAARVDKAHA